MANSSEKVSSGVKLIHICDRDGDMYELYERAEKTGQSFLIRIVQNRMTVDGTKMLDEVKKSSPIGSMNVKIPRNTYKNQREREPTFSIRGKTFEVKKPYSRRNDKHLNGSVKMSVVYIGLAEQP